jgi:peroxiredoxin
VHERYTDQGVVVLAINVGEERDEVAEFVVGHSYTFSVLLDTDGGVSDAYGVHIIPHTVVVDREGEMQYLAGGLDDVEEALRRVMVE